MLFTSHFVFIIYDLRGKYCSPHLQMGKIEPKEVLRNLSLAHSSKVPIRQLFWPWVEGLYKSSRRYSHTPSQLPFPELALVWVPSSIQPSCPLTLSPASPNQHCGDPGASVQDLRSGEIHTGSPEAQCCLQNSRLEEGYYCNFINWALRHGRHCTKKRMKDGACPVGLL